FDTYTDTNNLYLAKQAINGSDGQWLSTTVENFNDDAQDFTPTNQQNPELSKINFSSLGDLSKYLEQSTILNNTMPSSISATSFDDYLKENNDWFKDAVKFKNVNGNNETGEISFETEITYQNNFGDNLANGSVSYVTYIQATGFAQKDFVLTFKQDTDSAVTQFKKDYSAKKIVETNNKGWVIENLVQQITIKNQTINVTESMITISNPNDTSLQVEINIPIKTSASDNSGVLPVGFPQQDAKKTITYNGFTGTDAPSFVELPNDPNSTNNPNSGEELSTGAIAGIVIGCLALAAIIIATIVLIRIRAKARISV
ncbi:MAG: hypothetical protein K2G48_01080, partial [Malacoplasma sp.]|nr:hypothetical protein [Malacoplasma sp.]